MDQDFATLLIQNQWIPVHNILIWMINLRCVFELVIFVCTYFCWFFFHYMKHIDRNFVYVAIVLAAHQPAVTNSSSSEDEEGKSGSNVVRRRRLQKNSTNTTSEPEEEEVLESGQSEEEEEDEEQEGGRPAAALGVQGVQDQSSSILNKCILIALIVAISMGFGHFHGKSLLMLL